MRQLNAGQEVNVYIPSDRWEANLGDTSGVLTTYYAVVMVEESSSGSGAALPSTASALPLIGLLGVGSLFAAFLMRIRRRRDV
jgi:LPXTG-motif cell wall-anchored protein